MAKLLTAAMIFAALAPVAGGVAANGVYKCSGSAGSVVYQDAPCSAGTELRNFATDPPSLSVIPGTPAPEQHRHPRQAPRQSARRLLPRRESPRTMTRKPTSAASFRSE